jgi:hypothetical protein
VTELIAVAVAVSLMSTAVSANPLDAENASAAENDVIAIK